MGKEAGISNNTKSKKVKISPIPEFLYLSKLVSNNVF